MVQIAVMGYGTVGSGVVEVLNTNQASINKRAGDEINIKYVLDLREFPGDPVESKLIHDFETIVNDPEIKIVVEVMGGVEPAYTFTKSCLEAGKSVCTSNKELVARHGAELLEIARERNLNYLFEASVGGGIPIIRPLNSSLTADEITEITGILNGTTNYILTKMSYGGIDFDTALKNAQAKGYAERNPEADVEGYDACRKIAILTSLVSGRQVDFEDIYTEGITKVTAEDIKYAKKLGRAVKLLAMSKKEDGKFFAMVVRNLTDRGLILKKGTIVDSTIISAPTSTKNKEKKRDPDAHSVKKGTTWYFGYRAHIGVDKDTGLVHHVKVTAANVSDVKMTSALLMGDEEEVYGDSGYLGAEKQSDAIIRNRQGKKIRYKQNRKPSQIKKLSEGGQRKARKAEHEKSSVRAKVEHVFAVIKGQFRYRKTRYRGLRKQTAKLNMLFALANLVLADRHCLPV